MLFRSLAERETFGWLDVVGERPGLVDVLSAFIALLELAKRGSLKLTQTPVERTGRWLIETVMAWAEVLANVPGKYTKTLRATIPVVPVTTQPLNNPSWNYIFSRNTGSGLVLSGCDMTLQNSVNVTSPLYVMGNLCLKNTATPG